MGRAVLTVLCRMSKIDFTLVGLFVIPAILRVEGYYFVLLSLSRLRESLYVHTSYLCYLLQIVLVAASDTQRTCDDAVLALYRKYQIAIHNDNPARLTLASMQRFLVKSPLKVIINDRFCFFSFSFLTKTLVEFGVRAWRGISTYATTKLWTL